MSPLVFGALTFYPELIVVSRFWSGPAAFTFFFFPFLEKKARYKHVLLSGWEESVKTQKLQRGNGTFRLLVRESVITNRRVSMS